METPPQIQAPPVSPALPPNDQLVPKTPTPEASPSHSFTHTVVIAMGFVAVAAVAGFMVMTGPGEEARMQAAAPKTEEESTPSIVTSMKDSLLPSQLAAKRQMLLRAQAAMEPSLIEKLADVVRDIQAYQGTDIPSAKAFAQNNADTITRMQEAMKALEHINPEAMNSMELDAMLLRAQEFQSLKQRVLVGYNSVQPDEMSKAVAAAKQP